MNTTLLNFRVTDQVKNDFMTTCKLNCTTMTSEIVRFMNKYISDENKRFKSYQIDSQEINELKRRRLDIFPIQEETIGDLLTTPLMGKYRWEDSYD